MARRDADMTQGPIVRHLISFAVPMMIGMLFQQAYNTVDMIVVGHFVSKEAMAAVSSTGNIVNMLIGLCNGLSMGAGVVISQAYGAKDEKRLHTAVHTTVTVTFALCVLATIVGLLIVDPMLRAMDTPEQVLPQSTQYLRIYFMGISGLLLYNMGGGILRAVGDSKRPQYFLMLSAVLNIILDLLLVIVFDMGVAGVALATAIAQGISAALILFTLTREKSAFGLRWKELHVSGMELRRILNIGMPSGLQQALTSFSNVFVQSYINGFGDSAMAGWGAYNRLDIFILIPAMSIANASTTFVGQNWGARQPLRARQGANRALAISLCSTAILAGLMVAFARPLMSIFTPLEDVIDYGTRFLSIITPFYIALCFNQVFSGALRGIGNARTPMLIMLGSFVVFRQIYLYVSTSLGGGFVAVALAYPLGWVVCSLLITITYFRSRLFRAPVKEQEKNTQTA